MNAEELQRRLESMQSVYGAKAIGEVVLAVDSKERNRDASTFSGTLECGWVVLMHEPKDGGDMWVFGPMEWFE